MLAARRYDRILEVLQAEQVAEVARLAQVLDVSETTVRRDLALLAREGTVSRVRGGARARPGAEPPYAQVAARPHADRDAIAEAAAGLVADGDVLLLDIGTTVCALAARLRGRPVTVVTSSLAVLETLGDDDRVGLVLLGGTVRRNYRSTVGSLTERALRHVRADRAFLGTSGVLPDGSSWDTSDAEVPVKRGLLRAAEQVVLLAGPDKFPGQGLVRVCGPESVDVLVCRAGADPATLAAFGETGTTVIAI